MIYFVISFEIFSSFPFFKCVNCVKWTQRRKANYEKQGAHGTFPTRCLGGTGLKVGLTVLLGEEVSQTTEDIWKIAFVRWNQGVEAETLRGGPRKYVVIFSLNKSRFN